MLLNETGYVVAQREAAGASKATGRLEWLVVREGSRVKQGEVLARLGAGVNPEQMHAERVDGYNPLAVIDAIARKKEVIAKGDGPGLLETLTYRFSGHSPSDASSYR